jgi:hypothetical protein
MQTLQAKSMCDWPTLRDCVMPPKKAPKISDLASLGSQAVRRIR